MDDVISEIAARPAPKKRVLVTGAAGGTGHIAVQWAKALYGCRVAGTCGSAEKKGRTHRQLTESRRR